MAKGPKYIAIAACFLIVAVIVASVVMPNGLFGGSRREYATSDIYKALEERRIVQAEWQGTELRGEVEVYSGETERFASQVPRIGDPAGASLHEALVRSGAKWNLVPPSVGSNVVGLLSFICLPVIFLAFFYFFVIKPANNKGRPLATSGVMPGVRLDPVTNPLIDSLVKAAMQVRENAYAPYSGYKVGAAILDDQNRVHVGCNVENISYGGAICAERGAVTRMIAEGGKEIRQVVVVTKDGGAPCGFCRQVLSEFAPRPVEVNVIMVRVDAPDEYRIVTLADLAPFAFTSSEVGRTEPMK